MSKKYIVKDENITTYKDEKGIYCTQIRTTEHYRDSKKDALELINLMADGCEQFFASDKSIIVRICDDEDFKIIIIREISSSVDHIDEYRLAVLER